MSHFHCFTKHYILFQFKKKADDGLNENMLSTATKDRVATSNPAENLAWENEAINLIQLTLD